MAHKQSVLVIIKPDGMSKSLIGNVFTKLTEAKLELVGIGLWKVPRKLAEEHYKHIKSKPFYEKTIRHLLGEYHKEKRVLAMVYRGADAVKKCRAIAGATNPEEADPKSIRGAYGCVSSKGIFENVIHVSSDEKEAEREIKLWFEPEQILVDVFATKTKTTTIKKRVWAK